MKNVPLFVRMGAIWGPAAIWLGFFAIIMAPGGARMAFLFVTLGTLWLVGVLAWILRKVDSSNNGLWVTKK